MLTINHASGAGYYAMAGQGFDPDFIFTWPTGRMGVMEGEVGDPGRARAGTGGGPDGQRASPPAEVAAAVEAMRVEYETQLDARYAAARGLVDAVIYPEETRAVLAMALRTASAKPRPARRGVRAPVRRTPGMPAGDGA